MESKREKLTIGLLIISTSGYDKFIQPLIDSANRHFFPNSDIIIYLFSDKDYTNFKLPSRISLIVTPIKHNPWPASTLFRYRNFTNIAKKIAITDYAFYIDADMMIVSDINEELLEDETDIFAVRHPGFWNNSEWGSQGVITASRAYLDDNLKERYVCGGVQGGRTDKYLEACKLLADNIDADEAIGYRTPHNDETHWNFFVNKVAKLDMPYKTWRIKDLSPSFCMIPEQEARIQFGLTELEPIIYALTKNNPEELRRC